MFHARIARFDIMVTVAFFGKTFYTKQGLIVHDEWDLRVPPKQKFGRVVHGTESPGPSPHASPNAYNNILYVLPPL